MRYCITHESYDIMDDEVEMFDCLFVYALYPDELDLDGWEWVFSLPEPSEDELAIMDMNGEVLEADFIGE